MDWQLLVAGFIGGLIGGTMAFGVVGAILLIMDWFAQNEMRSSIGPMQNPRPLREGGHE